VHVLHGLLERVGSLGVHSLEELSTYSSRVSPAQRRKRYLAEGLPSAPGVYLFRDARDEVLYVGTSVDIRSRVRTYFTASEHRTRMAEMVALATSVVPVVCATTLEAQVRELRLIAEHAPRYNRRSRRPERSPWVKLTAEPFPRLSVVRDVRDDGATYVGPFSSRRAAEQAIDALHDVFALRQCRRRLGRSGGGSACALAEMGRCSAPCTRAADPEERQRLVAEYAGVVDGVRTALSGDCRHVAQALRGRIHELARTERFEQAAVVRDRMLVLVRATARTQRVQALARCAELVAARRRPVGGWEIVLVRYGRLAGSTVSPRGADPWPYVEALRATGEAVSPPIPALPAALPEETEKVLSWLEQDGTRLVQMTGDWSCPVHGAGAERSRLDPLAAAIGPVDPFDLPWQSTARSRVAAG
jgi:DNA polymerase-3 subunit epsilon